jgi:ribonuclease HII
MNSDSPARQSLITMEYERGLWSCGKIHVAGVDEVGRGPLAGPVVAAAVIFAPHVFIPEVDDSKVLPEADREVLYSEIFSQAKAVAVGIVDHAEIDELNILNATFKAMHAALANLSVTPDHVLVDGNRFEGTGIPFTTIIDGDALCFSIAAASIVAKVTRDRLMNEYDTRFPGYGFAKHKGYATKEHREAIFRLGYCDIHRRSFELNTQLELEL